MRDGESLNQKKPWPLSSALRPFCSAKLAVVGRYLQRDLRFDELRKVLESYGYKMNAPISGSSHYTFRKSGCQPITIPKHEPIKKVYVELVRQVVESEARNDEDAE